jgi:regulator of replication initiation timing
LSAEASALRRELAAVQRKAQNLSADLKQKVADIESVERNHREIDEERKLDHSVALSELRTKLADSTRSSSRLLSQNKDLAVAVSKLERQLSVATNLQSSLKSENDSLVSENAALKQELKTLRSDSARRIAELTERNAALVAGLEKFKGADIQEVDRKNDTLKAIVVDTQSQLLGIRLENSKFVSQVADYLSLQTQFEALSEENDALRQEVTRRSIDYNSLLEELNVDGGAATNELQQELSAEKASNEELRRIVDIVVDQNKALRQSNSRRSKVAGSESDEELSAALSNLSKSTELKLVLENQDLKKQVRALRDEREAEQTENRRLKDRCARLQGVVSSPTRNAEVYSEVLAQNEELTEENGQLKELVSVLHSRHSIDVLDDDDFPLGRRWSDDK